ncbi:T3SS effector HopA1 family protein [Kitasatospora cineracea]|uniref:T3SS effector HopA1 family protein n=1 Tax=Kitasatospora cineracea TaxID=88074 RepID=UPI003826A39C
MPAPTTTETAPLPAPAELPPLAGPVAALLDTVVLTPGTVAVGERSFDLERPEHARTVLRDALYESWHAGIAPPPPDARRPGRPRGGGDLERALMRAVPHRRTRVTATVVGPAPAVPGELPAVVVAHGGVRLAVPVTAVTGPDPAAEGGTVLTAGSTVLADVPALRPWLSPGFLLVHGSAGGAQPAGGLLRVYLHVARPEAAEAVWAAVLGALEADGVRYQAKILSEPRHYPRRDAMVVYLGAAQAAAAHTVVAATAGLRGGELAPAASVFTAPLAPGAALAWEPADPRPGRRGLSFGQHRAAAVADGLLDHHRDPGAGTRAEAVARAMHRAGIRPDAPERNR